jgi:hypothetical protein
LLAVLGYAGGAYQRLDPRVGQGLRLNQIAQIGLNYWGVQRYHMSNLERFHPYVMHWAAANLIIAAPAAYEFSLGRPMELSPRPVCQNNR